MPRNEIQKTAAGKRTQRRQTRQSPTQQSQTQQHQAAPEAALPPAKQPSVEELRYALVRKLVIFSSDWRYCPRRICKRGRACVPLGLDCGSAERRPRRAVKPEREAIEKAALRRSLQKRIGAG